MISIITPCYNDNKIVQRAIYSALQQKIPDGELILVDDGSKEPVENIWGKAVKLIRHPQNRGLSAALNTGIKAAKNDRFVILSADDQFRSDWAKIMLPHIDKADIISCDFQGENGKAVKCKPGSLKDLVNSNCHSYSAIIKKRVWEMTGGFKEYMNPSWEDWEFFLNAAKLGFTWHHVSEPVHIYHRNPKGRDADAQDKETLLRGKLDGTHQDLFGQGKGVVTFVIPCYNQEKFVLDALESISQQIYPHVNAVVVDDGSTGDIIATLKQSPLQPVVIRQKNKGLSAARNTGAKYASEILKSQYLVMLDADDKISPLFVEKCLMAKEDQKYVYSDVTFFGSGGGQLVLPDFSCLTLSKRHIHACTFLMDTEMWEAIVAKRGYGYDENMKKGYEDWEFILGAVEAGYCGKRIPEFLFHYRQHPNGSMRQEAEIINNDLVRYISSKHIWMQGVNVMPCSGCGGRRMSGKVSYKLNGGARMLVNVPGVGEVDGTTMIEATFHGTSLDTKTKVGRGLPGRGSATYKFSGAPKSSGAVYPNVFTIFAIDANLFMGPFTFKKLHKNEPVEIAQVKKTEIVFEKSPFIADEPDDLTVLKYIGAVGQKKLYDAGYFHYHSLNNPTILVETLGMQTAKAQEVVKEALQMSEQVVTR